MLVLSRRINESIVINGDILITVLEVGRNGQVRLGIDAPRHYQVYRRELWLEIEQENRLALASALDPNANTVAPAVPNQNDQQPRSLAISKPAPTNQNPDKR
jgi:carbon storage regulator